MRELRSIPASADEARAVMQNRIKFAREHLQESAADADVLLSRINEVASDGYASSYSYLAAALLLEVYTRRLHENAVELYEIEREIVTLSSALRTINAETEEEAD